MNKLNSAYDLLGKRVARKALVVITAVMVAMVLFGDRLFEPGKRSCVNQYGRIECVENEQSKQEK